MKITALINQLKSLFDYSVSCASQHHYWGGCAKFWAYVYLSSSFLLLIICALIGYIIHKENSELKNYLKRKTYGEATSPAESMKRHA